MKRLKLDIGEIAALMEIQDRIDQNYYLDTETGDVLPIPASVMDAVDEGGSPDDLQDWEKELIEPAREILVGTDRYQEIPVRPSREGYFMMAEFVETVEDEGLREKLEIALNGKGAFRRFKDVLLEVPEVEKSWFGFKEERETEVVREWLKSLGIQAVKK